MLDCAPVWCGCVLSIVAHFLFVANTSQPIDFITHYIIAVPKWGFLMEFSLIHLYNVYFCDVIQSGPE